MNIRERIDLLMKARNLLHKQENGKEVTSVDISLSQDYVEMVADDMVDENFKERRGRDKAINAMAFATMILDRLQVELCEDTPYPIPDAAETRKRINAALDELQKIEAFIGKLYEE